MRLRLRIRTLLLLVALVAIVIGAGRWLVRRQEYCQTRAREHAEVARSYELALSLNYRPSPWWTAKVGQNHSRRAAYSAIAARHRDASRRYAAASNCPWVPLPAETPDFPKSNGFLPLP